MEIPGWIIRPYSCDLQQIPIERKESLIDLRSDDVVKSSFPEQYYNILWCNIADQYPALCARTKVMILSFSTSYLVEKGFSAVVGLLTKKRNRLEITKRGGDLRLFLTKFSPDLKNLVTVHRPNLHTKLIQMKNLHKLCLSIW
ncbi:SCAN domain-containing protein 3 [Oopsacas minuta]|uniref:SCAN domain-containing protein 3 n=1 Tax=Oopsacas minuta TaxID=111878 RepID=A0AAV7KFU3_9METZ|nr:SCAN domain-containing protein 3 [Oopsacas minuta]